MKHINGLALLIGLILVITACTTLSPEVRARQVTCSQVIIFPVFDIDGTLIKKFVSDELKSHYEYDASAGMYYRYPDNIETWNAFYSQIDAGITKANAQLAYLYAESGLINGVYFNKRALVEGLSLDGTSDLGWNNCPDSHDPIQNDLDWYDGIRPRLGNYCNYEDYCTNTTFAGDTTYVTVSTPGGSRVDYSYPTSWLNQIMWSSFGNQDALDFNPEFVTPDVVLNEQAYGEILLRTLVGDGNDREVASFTLVISDFQGRNELRPVIAKAMEVAAVQTGHPVMMTLKGMMSSGQYAVANISAHQDGIKINGWMALTLGSVKGSGGDMTLEANYSSYFEDLTRGSIYVLNP